MPDLGSTSTSTSTSNLSATSSRRPKRRKPKPMRLPTPDVDLTGGFRLDLKTVVLLIAIVGQWYDGRNQGQRQAEIAKVQSEQLTASLLEVKRVQTMQGYDLADIKVALAARGIFLRSANTGNSQPTLEVGPK